MRIDNLKKTFSFVLLVSIFSQTAFVFLPKHVSAQANLGGGGNVQAGFDATGIAGSALVCSGIADKMAGLLNGLFSSAVPTTVPINDPANDTRENCLKQITRQIINKILDKITLSTVNWINSGFAGDPLWLENPEQFFGNIARDEINNVTGWFTCNGSTNCESYPFGRLVMSQVLLGLQRQSQQNLRFSLNQVLAHGNYEQFRYNFNVGGWAGYTAFLEPQNNPFGNQILINDDLARRIGGTTVNTSRNFNAQLTQSGGFLSPRICAVSGTGGTEDYIPEDSPLHLGNYYQVLPPGAVLGDVTFAQLPSVVQDELDDFQNLIDQADAYNALVIRSKCKQWKTTTPGQVVGSRLTQGLDTATNQLIAADDVAENIGLIFDALLNQLITAGLKGLSSDNQDSVLLAQVNGEQPGAVSTGQAPPPVPSTILGTGPAGIASIPILEVQNQFIENAEDAVDLLEEIIPKIYSLDYCVPGPNPRWATVAEANLQQVLNQVPASNGLPTDENETYYRNRISELTGATINESLAMYNHTQFLAFMQEVFARYRTRMLQNYSLTMAPPTARYFLEQLFTDLPVYNSELSELNDYLVNIQPLLPTLESIENELEALAAANNGILNPNSPQVQVQVSIFNSISDNLATQTQLNTLVDRLEDYQVAVEVITEHLQSCVIETNPGTYIYPNQRMPYPASMPLFSFPGLLPPNTTFLPGVGLGNGSSDINIEINGVQVLFSTNNLSTFEGILQSVY